MITISVSVSTATYLRCVQYGWETWASHPSVLWKHFQPELLYMLVCWLKQVGKVVKYLLCPPLLLSGIHSFVQRDQLQWNRYQIATYRFGHRYQIAIYRFRHRDQIAIYRFRHRDQIAIYRFRHRYQMAIYSFGIATRLPIRNSSSTIYSYS